MSFSNHLTKISDISQKHLYDIVTVGEFEIKAIVESNDDVYGDLAFSCKIYHSELERIGYPFGKGLEGLELESQGQIYEISNVQAYSPYHTVLKLIPVEAVSKKGRPYFDH